MWKRIATLVILLSAAGIAQSNGVLTGMISTQGGEAVAGTRIALVEIHSGARYESRTDDLGIWAVSLLKPGEYRLDLYTHANAIRSAGTIVLKADEKKSWRVVLGPETH